MSLFTGRGRVSEEDHAGFVDEGEEAEVTGVLAGRFVDEQAFRSETVWRLSARMFCSYGVEKRVGNKESVTYLPDLKRKIILQPRVSYPSLMSVPPCENLHKRMRKPHFTSIHDAIPHTFYQCKNIVVLWV